MFYLRRLIDATRYSFKGLASAWKHEPAFRTEIALTPFILSAALLLPENASESLLLLGSWILVLIVELLNSAIEAIVDRIGPETHELSGRAKDLASAAVFVTLMLAALLWVWVLFR